MPLRFIGLFTAVAFFFILFRIVPFHVIGWTEEQQLDFPVVFYRAAEVTTATESPYTVPGYFNPPWLAWLMKPLALLSWPDAYALWTAVMVMLTMRCITQMGGGILAQVLVMTSPPMLEVIINGQVDPLILFGLLRESWLFLLIKPQVAGMALPLLLLRARMDRLFMPVLVLSFVLYGFWPLLVDGRPITTANLSLFPYTIVPGLLLFAVSLWRNDKYGAALATPFLSPYLSGNSFLVYGAIVSSRYGRLTAVSWAIAMWAMAYGRFSN